jgi:hypothetical protein
VSPPTPESKIPIAASLTGLAYLELYNYWDPFITASSKLS